MHRRPVHRVDTDAKGRWLVTASDDKTARVWDAQTGALQLVLRPPIADGNEEIVAFVQLLPGSRTTPEDLMGFIRFQLTSYKRPSEIIVLDALPATSTGKILKHKLAESLQSA